MTTSQQIDLWHNGIAKKPHQKPQFQSSVARQSLVFIMVNEQKRNYLIGQWCTSNCTENCSYINWLVSSCCGNNVQQSFVYNWIFLAWRILYVIFFKLKKIPQQNHLHNQLLVGEYSKGKRDLVLFLIYGCLFFYKHFLLFFLLTGENPAAMQHASSNRCSPIDWIHLFNIIVTIFFVLR